MTRSFPTARRAAAVPVLAAVLWSTGGSREGLVPGATARAQAVHANRFDADISAMLERDRAEPPPQESILFIGSSIFRLWVDLKAQMAPLPVFNRAFGGARTWEVLAYMDRIVLPYKPKVVVYYCGSNDVNAGEPASAILERTQAFLDRVHAALPATRVVYLSINRSPDKRARWAVVDDVNAAMKETASRTPWLTYVESNRALFDGGGTPRSELYLSDGLHFKAPAYVLFTDILKPVVAEAWRAVSR
jgi:lysophospholipase L1-like esterase